MDITLNDSTSRFVRAINGRYKPKAIYLYGSQAKGLANTDSDIDIAVVIEPISASAYMDIFADLCSMASEFDGNIEPNLLVDDGSEDKYSFLYEVKKTGQKIYG